MADISYTPTFRHVLWEDRKDRVEASGPNGFNVRFNTIASDLRQLSAVVTRIGAAIDAPGDPNPQGQQRLSFTPVLRATTANPVAAWTYAANGAATASLQLFGGVSGVANLSLPDQLRLTSLRVVGSIDGTSVDVSGGVTLARTPLQLVVPPATPETVAAAPDIGGDNSVGAFDVAVPITASRALIDTSVFRYVFTATFSTIISGTITIDAVHLTFTPSS